MRSSLYLCDHCGTPLTEDDFVNVRSLIGECWGQPAYEEYNACPVCRGYSIREATCGDCEHFAHAECRCRRTDCEAYSSDEPCAGFEKEDE